MDLALATPIQAAIPSIPPELIAQLKSMPPSEQRALAKQYGINLDLILGTAGANDNVNQRSSLGAPGELLQQVQLEKIVEELDSKQLRQQEEEEEEELQRFGANLFDSEISTFAPVDNIPVPESYRLGIGDELRVMLIGKEQGDIPLLVDRDGSVTLPKLGRVILSGFNLSRS